MVDVELEPDDYELLEKWYGMLFGEGDKRPKGKDLLLYNKLSQMHIGLMKTQIKDAEKFFNGED